MCTPPLPPGSILDPDPGGSGVGVGFLKDLPVDSFLPFQCEGGAAPGYICYLGSSCTEYASYPQVWDVDVSQPYIPGYSVETPFTQKLAMAFEGKGARIIDLDFYYGDAALAGADHDLAALFVPNYGSAERKWWWSRFGTATASELTDVINGKAWPAGHFKQDNIKKKLVALTRSKLNGKFHFVLNEWKPGEAWWWGYGASTDDIKLLLDGEAWADFKKDGIQKRLVLLKRHGPDNWTFIMVPRSKLLWDWHENISIKDLVNAAKAANQRVISLEAWPLPPDPADFNTPFSAILVQNA
jgi:hypothetical protein